MRSFLLILHLVFTVSMIAVILIQRSEGGAAFGSGTLGSFSTVRGTANLLTRVTGILATLFMITSISLALLANRAVKEKIVTGALAKEAPKPSEPLKP